VVYCTVQAKYAINGNTIIVDLEIMYFSFVNSCCIQCVKDHKGDVGVMFNKILEWDVIKENKHCFFLFLLLYFTSYQYIFFYYYKKLKSSFSQNFVT
jgi:hypothetical protein